jgi:succinate dehydrogenase / fumarate reductase membrane anchor subunit
MLQTSSAPKTHEGTWLWLYKMVAGGLIVILLGVHFIVNHMVAPEGLLSYNDILRYYTNPIIPVMEAAFLIFVTSHALIGLRSILLDLNPSAKLLRMIDIVLIAIGVISNVYGIWLIVVIVQRGMAL